MMAKQPILRYLFGYALGGTLFLLIIPSALYLIAQSTGGAMPFPPVVRLGLALVLGLVGLFFVGWSNWDMVRKGRGGPTDFFNIAVSPRTKHLIIEGPYRFTRNPMVFGAFMFYFGITLGVASWPAFACVVVFLPIALTYVRLTEEKRLARDFGSDFSAYKQHVPRFFPCFPKK